MKNHSPELLTPAVTRQLLKEGMERNQRFKCQVTSRSMAPLLLPGDHVILQQTRHNQLAAGDLVVLGRGPDLYIHRVIQIDREGWLHTKGDNLPVCDPRVPAEDVLGQVVALERGKKITDLTMPKWTWTNRILGTISRWEARLMEYNLQRWKTQFAEEPAQRAMPSPDGPTGSKGGGVKRRIRALVRLPFRFLIRLVVELARFRSLSV